LRVRWRTAISDAAFPVGHVNDKHAAYRKANGVGFTPRLKACIRVITVRFFGRSGRVMFLSTRPEASVAVKAVPQETTLDAGELPKN
jgi:hypothetical protein